MTPVLKTYAYAGAKPGPKLLCLGAIHGNETCGTSAIMRVIAEIDAGVTKLAHGSVTFLPICNPAAYSQNVRYTQENLNRVISKATAPASYEHALAQQIIALVDTHDILFDIHSYSSGKKPFLFLDQQDDEHAAYALSTGIENWITGWGDLYADQPELSSGDTVGYARSVGKKALVIEAGQHSDPASHIVAYHALKNILSHHGVIDMPVSTASTLTRKIRMTALHVKKSEGQFAAPWENLDPVKKGDVLATFSNGEKITAPDDGYVILPRPQAQIGEEWIYFGTAAAA